MSLETTVIELDNQAQQAKQWRLSHFFQNDPHRFKKMSLHACGILFDCSKNLLTPHTLQLLYQQATQQHIAQRFEDMCTGAVINTTEQRAVLHTALRSPASASVFLNGHNVVADIHDVLQRMERFVEQVHQGHYTSSTSQRFTDVVHIGIGGSDLGPKMVTAALKPFHQSHTRVHFVSNADPSDLAETLRGLNAGTTLFLIASKTFTTQETMANAHAAMGWLKQHLGSASDVARHCVALSSNTQAAASFGIAEERVFGFWDWVGGRYSLWSAIGLPIAFAVGMEAFKELLRGAHAMDTHARTEPFERNMAVTYALVGYWNIRYLGHTCLAVLPYSQLFEHLPAYLQQLDMESNGKSVTRDGVPVSYATGPLVFGEPGTNGQHAFYQWLHQGNTTVPCDFIGYARTPYHEHQEQHRILLAHMLAQSQALMQGRPPHPNPHKQFHGNKPSNTLLLDTLSPYTLGALIALYEAKVVLQSFLWDINAFDQWGVELGKELAQHTLQALKNPSTPYENFDSSTAGLIQAITLAQAAPKAPA